MSKRDHHKAALEFLWEVFTFLCITIGVCAAGLAVVVVAVMVVDQAPLLWLWVVGVLLGIAGFYWLGYELSKDEQREEEANAARAALRMNEEA